MMRRVVQTAWGLAMIGGGLSACGPGPGFQDAEVQRLETALCDKAAACGCFDADSVDIERVCGEWPPDHAYFRAPNDTRLTFDPDCIDPWMAWVEDLTCTAASWPRYAEICPLYYGTRDEGMECFAADPMMSHCAQGLSCILGICLDPQHIAFGDHLQLCDLGNTCYGERVECYGGLCLRLPLAGEPCLGGFSCADSAICERGTCQPLPRPGEPCRDGQCHPQARCEIDSSTPQSDVCVPLAAVGEPCRGHSECLSGNCPAGRCEHPAGPGDPCSSQLPCGPDLRCIDFQCEVTSVDGRPISSVCELE